MSIPTRTVHVAAFEPERDSHGLIDAWAEPNPALAYGWAPASPSPSTQSIDGNRRPARVDFEIYLPTAAGAPRSRWTIPGHGTFEQVGDTASYADGPWWSGAGAVAYLRRVEG